MYTIEWLDVVLPLGNVATSLAKNAPSIPMGERLAAVRLRRTGCRSSRENPHARYSSKDHILDCVPVSAMAIVVTWVLWAFSVIVAGLSTEMVMGTVGWSLSWACHHSPLVAWFCSSCSLHFHCFCGDGFPALLACGCS